MSFTQEESKSSRQDIMYIRGIPFKCPTSGDKAPVPDPDARQDFRPAADCPSRQLVRCLSGDASQPAPDGPTARVQAGLMRNRRSVRVFTEQVVPMRTLRDLLIQAGADLGKTSRLIRFVMVEAAPAMERIRGQVEAWLVREGRSLKDDSREAAPDKGIFGGAPHLAVVHGPRGVAGAAEACAMALARLEWAAAGAGIGACFAGEFLQAAAADTALAADLTIPDTHTAYGALLLGYSSFHVRDPKGASRIKTVWL
jgi:hypothetical protein